GGDNFVGKPPGCRWIAWGNCTGTAADNSADCGGDAAPPRPAPRTGGVRRTSRGSPPEVLSRPAPRSPGPGAGRAGESRCWTFPTASVTFKRYPLGRSPETL